MNLGDFFKKVYIAIPHFNHAGNSWLERLRTAWPVMVIKFILKYEIYGKTNEPMHPSGHHWNKKPGSSGLIVKNVMKAIHHYGKMYRFNYLLAMTCFKKSFFRRNGVYAMIRGTADPWCRLKQRNICTSVFLSLSLSPPHTHTHLLRLLDLMYHIHIYTATSQYKLFYALKLQLWSPMYLLGWIRQRHHLSGQRPSRFWA